MVASRAFKQTIIDTLLYVKGQDIADARSLTAAGRDLARERKPMA